MATHSSILAWRIPWTEEPVHGIKKIRDIKGTFHAKMSSIKDRYGIDVTEAEDIKKIWQEYTKNCTKKIFTTQIITMV